MENASTEELHKLSTMKLTISFFTTKLENFISETNATDENLLMLLSHLTDTIQSFVLAANVIRTNLTIESTIDKRLLSCENIFECHACNVQTGKTYNSVVNHISSAKHKECAKQFERQKKLEIPPKNAAARPTTSINPASGILPLPVINQKYVIHNMYQPRNGPLIQPRAILPRPITGINPQLPFNANQMHSPPITCPIINNMMPVDGIATNNQFSSLPFSSSQFSSPDYFLNYKELFKMPPPVNVVGFQQNVVSPSNDFLLQHSTLQYKDESEKYQSQTKTRTRRRRRVKAKDFNTESVAQIDNKFFDENTILFLKGNHEDEILQFIDAAKKLSCPGLYADIIKNLKERCQEMGLDVDVKCFGSRIIGIGSYKSDIDLNISITDCDLTTDSFLQKLLDLLSKDSNWRNAVYIKSRVALVRARNINMNIDCDITFNNELAMSNTELIKYFYEIQPESRKLVLFIRMLAEKVKLHPQINTYTINLLVFFFFQIKGYLPTVLDLIEKPTMKYWPNKFKSKPVEELNIKIITSFKVLCLDFLNFYAHQVDFESNILSTLTGTTIPKALFGTDEYRGINDCFNGLLQYMEENTRAAECIRTNFKMAMCIQDPFSHDHNVSRCVGKLNLKRFKECCHETYKIICSQLTDMFQTEKYSC